MLSSWASLKFCCPKGLKSGHLGKRNLQYFLSFRKKILLFVTHYVNCKVFQKVIVSNFVVCKIEMPVSLKSETVHVIIDLLLILR